jgi:hypothetical protein
LSHEGSFVLRYIIRVEPTSHRGRSDEEVIDRPSDGGRTERKGETPGATITSQYRGGCAYHTVQAVTCGAKKVVFARAWLNFLKVKRVQSSVILWASSDYLRHLYLLRHRTFSFGGW